MKTSLLDLRILFFACLASLQLHAQILPYKDSNLSVEVRVNDLLSRMTAEEKFYQVFMIAHDGVFQESDYTHGIFGIEMNTSGLNEAAGQQMLDYSKGNAIESELAEMLRIQKYLVTQTRLGIPAIFFGESLHGVVAKGGVSYPQSIALAASFNTSLMEEVSDAIATASFQRGWRMVLSPVVNIHIYQVSSELHSSVLSNRRTLLLRRSTLLQTWAMAEETAIPFISTIRP